MWRGKHGRIAQTIGGGCEGEYERVRTEETVRKRFGRGQPVEVVVSQELVEKVDTVRIDV